MAEKSNAGGKQPDKGKDENDLENLPPLSEFESSEGSGSDSGLPPLGGKEEPFSGLPPISDIPVETPVPTGGAIKPPPSSIETGGRGRQTPRPSAPDTPVSDSAFDTPTLTPAGGRKGTGFQDLGTDSDFTPETPDIGIAPESEGETPMFDSSFGALSDAATTPTQSMETPIFGATPQPGGRRSGFDDDAFGGGFGAAPGTPVPDFSPDTAAPTQPSTPPPVSAGPPSGRAAPGRKGMGVAGVLVSIVLLIVGLAVGILLGPMVSHNMRGMPMNPWKTELEQAQSQLSLLRNENEGYKRQIAEFMQQPPDQMTLTPEELDALRQQKADLTAEVAAVMEELQSRRNELSEIERDIELKSEDYLRAEQEYEDLVNQTSITMARRDGLLAEVDRLQSQVGLLEDADQRRIKTKEALEHAIDLLAITIREGIPLTPEKYSHAARVAAVEQLKAKASAANWVDPELVREYTALYRAELEVARSREYFFAKVPTRDRFGTDRDVWAECVMNGNWSVYYRTIDGKNVGIYQNVAESGAPRYEFVQALPPELLREVEATVQALRVKDYDQRIQTLADKQTLTETKTAAQKIYDSM